MKDVQTIQRTSKKYKAMQFAGVLAICLGIVFFAADKQNAGGTFLLCGIIGYASGRILAWWHHA